MRRRQKFSIILFVVYIGILASSLCYIFRLCVAPGPGDFIWPLRAAADLLAGCDPYNHPFHVLSIPYPLPAAFVGLLFCWLPVPVSSAVFFGASSALLAFGILRSREKHHLLVFASPLYFHSLMFAQWPPLIMAMAFFPSLTFLALVKPQTAIPMLLSYSRWTKAGILLAVFIGILSLVIYPLWPLRWLSQISPYEGVSPILVWSAGGPLLVLALLRWRDRDARLLFLMALAPQRMFYDQLSLFLVPRSKAQFVGFLLLSWVGFLFFLKTGDWAWSQTALIYLPALLIVLHPLLKSFRSRRQDSLSELHPKQPVTHLPHSW